MKMSMQAVRERKWLEEFERYQSARELRVARLKAMWRVIGVLPGGRRQARSALAHGGIVSIDSIVGVVGKRGTARRLPVLGRKLAAAWHRGFLAAAEDEAPTLGVQPGRGGWYLTGGTTDLLRLELARAKGARTVSVRVVEELQPCLRRARRQECGEDARCSVAGLAG